MGQPSLLPVLGWSVPKVNGKSLWGQVARTSLHHAEESRALAGFHRYLRADAIPIRPRSYSFHSQHVVLIAIVVAQQSSRPVVGGDE